MKGAAPIPIVALVTHARHVPALERDRFAAAIHRELAVRAHVWETCHRVEAYVVSADDAARLAPATPVGGHALAGEQAVRHAMTVTVGRDSVVVGEDQILHQLRASVDTARARGTLDTALERLFALALQAGRRARSWRQGPARSLADVAIASIEGCAGPIRGRDVLVVGAGRMGRLAAKAAVDASTADFVAWLDGRDGRAVAEALVARADREREAELAVLWRRLPDLEPEARHAIEGMTRHLANRLLREPLERLGRDTEGRDERAIRDIFAL